MQQVLGPPPSASLGCSPWRNLQDFLGFSKRESQVLPTSPGGGST